MGKAWDAVSDFVSPVTDVFNDVVIQPISDVFAGADDLVFQPVTSPISQATSALDDAIIQPITEPISDIGVAIDDSVNEIIPGGWGTLAQIAAAIATSGSSLAVQAAAAAAAGAGSDFAKNKDLKSAVQKGAISGATRYGLGTLGEMMGPTDVLSADDAYMGQAMNNLSSTAAAVPEGAVTSIVPEATVQSASYGAGQVPFDTDVPVYYNGYVPMTPEQVAADNPSLYPEVQINATNAANAAKVIPEAADPMGDLIKQQQLNQSMNSFNELPDINGVPQRDMSQLADRTGWQPKDYAAPYSMEKAAQIPGAAYDMAKEYISSMSYPQLAMSAAGLYGLSNLAGGKDKKQTQAQAQAEADAAKKAYTYGTAGDPSSNYLLRNRVNAGNVYSNATGYRPLTRYADGGEVQSFGIGGKISDAFTRVAQPFEKAVIRPIGEAAPFLKDLAPYAGMAAGAMMGNPAMAAGIGGIASGFGKPGGFDMKRALMGGIAAYGMSNLAGGLEAAGQAPLTDSPAVPFESYPDPQNQAGGFYGPSGQTNQLPTANPTFRDTDAMQRGVGNLLQNSNTPAYKDAMGALTSKVGIYNTGVPLVMGATGMMGVDESNALKAESDKAFAAGQADTDKFSARVAAGKKRAQQAVNENPYRFAEGGVINPPDDQTKMMSASPMQAQAMAQQQAAPLQGLAENQMMQSAGLGGNALTNAASGNGVSGLFSQLTSSQSNNDTQYNTQAGTPQSVVLPSYGGSGSSNNVGGSGSGGGAAPGSGGAFPLQGQYGIVKMAAGGMTPPRFLSGGGDGMSDSIRANIEGTQEARLADGEFVIPADVVSHLGNGSSKAGAKQLYAMMDRVRKARTGNPEQGREIKPAKFMPV
jgi:hypothetical protein